MEAEQETDRRTGGRSMNTARQAVGMVRERAHAVIDQATEYAHPVVENVTTRARHTTHEVSHIAETVEAHADDFYEDSMEYLERFRERVRKRPISSLGIAALSGYLLNRIFSSP